MTVVDIPITAPAMATVIAYADSLGAGERFSVLHGAKEAIADAGLPQPRRMRRLDQVLAGSSDAFREGYVLGMAAVGEFTARKIRDRRDDLMLIARTVGVAA